MKHLFIGTLIGFHFGIYFYLILSIPTVVLIYFNLCFLVFSFLLQYINFHIAETKIYIIFYSILSVVGFVVWGYVWYLNLPFASSYTFFLLLGLLPIAVLIFFFNLTRTCKTIPDITKNLKLNIKDIYFNNICKICEEQLGIRIKTGLLNCGHFYHKECILQLGDNAFCPNCNIIISETMQPFESYSN